MSDLSTDDVRLGFRRGADVSYGYPAQIADKFDRWLAEHDRAVASEAWDEGWDRRSSWLEIHHGAHLRDGLNPHNHPLSVSTGKDES